MNLWLLALIGCLTSWLGDILCVMAARNGALWLVALSGVLFAMAAPVWYYMSRATDGGFVVPAMAWNVVATVLSFMAIIVMERSQTPRQWVGLGLVFLGVWVRG